MARLSREFYRRDTVELAQSLLGQRLVRVIDGVRLSGLIVETEAYLGAPDRAAHTYKGQRTARNASMFLDGGHAYVYFTYGMHYCMNVTAGRKNEPVAVLIRALEPREGVEEMYRRRLMATRDTQLCSGPGKLCQALGVDRSLDGVDLVSSDVFFIERARRGVIQPQAMVTTTRVGVAYAGEWAQKPLRFYLKGNPHVSRP